MMHRYCGEAGSDFFIPYRPRVWRISREAGTQFKVRFLQGRKSLWSIAIAFKPAQRPPRWALPHRDGCERGDLRG